MVRSCIVIGGGPAGMMAAIEAASRGSQVTLYEKNEKLGKKLFITGKGRCNITNDCDAEVFFQNVVSNLKFLYSSYYSFDQTAVINRLQSAGCKTKVERGNRVFPVSDHSSDVIKALQVLLKENKVVVSLNTQVTELIVEMINDKKTVTGVKLKNGEIKKADSVILATGGASYPSTGSTGDGYRMAKKVGHNIKPIHPSLVPFVIKEEWCKALQGLSLKNVNIAMTIKGKEIYHEFGEMLFTHFGVSGPLILSASSYYMKQNSDGEVAKLNLDLKPALTEEQLDKRILRDFEKNQNRQFKNSLDELLPSKLIPIMVSLSKIPPDKPVHEVTKEERKTLVFLIKNLTMTIVGVRGLEEAIITQGGVATKEINPSTMESKIINNLFFAGEIIDVDALTGGFNLQIAWSTGFLAGNSIRRNENEL